MACIFFTMTFDHKQYFVILIHHHHSLTETIVTPEQFAELLCDDLDLPSATFVPAIAASIKQQVEQFTSDMIPDDEEDRRVIIKVCSSVTSSLCDARGCCDPLHCTCGVTPCMWFVIPCMWCVGLPPPPPPVCAYHRVYYYVDSTKYFLIHL